MISVSLQVKFGHGEWIVGSVYYARKDDIPLAIIIPAVLVPMLLFIAVSVYCYRFDKLLKETHSAFVFLCADAFKYISVCLFVVCVCVCVHKQEEESAGRTRIREGETPAGESGGECSRPLQERVHRYTQSPESCEITRLTLC